MDELHIVSLNVKGLNVPEKCRMLQNDMKRMKADIVLLQETHFRENAFPILKNRFYPTVYHSTYSETKSRGVSIQISARVPWSLLDIRTDPMGRYLFLKGMIGEVKVTIANLYAPNCQQDVFTRKHLKLLQTFSEGQLIMGGDLNTALIPSEDTSAGISSTPRGTRKMIHAALHAAQLIDVWRLWHPGERDYTFYSQPHHSYSRIDYLFVPHGQLQAVRGATIGSITWSDHAPVMMRYALTDFHRGQRKPWRLNESLLQDPETLADITREITHYFQANTSSDGDTGLVWEAHKAVIRGVLIKHGARLKKMRTEQMTLLINKLQTLETSHKQNQTRQIGAELDTIRMQIKDLLHFKAKAALQISRKKVYESGNKCGRLLAQSLRTQKLASYIPHVTSPEGQKRSLPQQITNEFKSYYEKLYNLPTTPQTPEQMTEYLTKSLMPTLQTETRDILEEPITLPEIQLAIRNTKPGKAPGPDGLTTQYYKTLLPSLGNHLLKLFNNHSEGDIFHSSTLQAQISVIPKEWKDQTQCGNYRPISLLNTDLKLFT